MTLDSIKSDSDSNTAIIESGPRTHSKNSTTTSSNPDPDLICPVCNCSSISSCRNCKKISYCGKAHQRLHWKIHKSQCYPLIHQYDPILGSRLIATRNIKPGEIIWKEKSLLSGPDIISVNAEKVEEYPKLCLGCYRVVNSDYVCPSCSWSMCGPNCGGKLDHEKLECKIFTARKQLRVTDFGGSGESQMHHRCKYSSGAITILRGVLFQELDPPRWKSILDLDDMWNGTEVECDNFVNPPITSESSNHNPNTITTEFGQFCHEFIMSLNLPNVGNEDVALVLRVVSHRRCEVYKDELCNLLQNG